MLFLVENVESKASYLLPYGPFHFFQIIWILLMGFYFVTTFYFEKFQT